MDIVTFILNNLKTFVETIIAVFPIIKTFTDARSKTAQTVLEGHNEIATTMAGPERDKIDAERLRAFAEYTRSVVPFAIVEYLYFVTKLITLIGLMRAIQNKIKGK